MIFNSPELVSFETTLDLLFRAHVHARNNHGRKVHYRTMGREVWIGERISYPSDTPLWLVENKAKLQFVPDRSIWILYKLGECGVWIKAADAPEEKLPILLEAAIRWFFW